MNLADCQFSRLRRNGALNAFTHVARRDSPGLYPTDRQVRLEVPGFTVIAEALRFTLDLTLQPAQGVQIAVHSDPHYARPFGVRETPDTRKRKSKGRNSLTGAIQRRGEPGERRPGDVAEEFEREVELIRTDPADGVAVKPRLEVLLDLLQFGDLPGIERNRDESANLLRGGGGGGHDRMMYYSFRFKR